MILYHFLSHQAWEAAQEAGSLHPTSHDHHTLDGIDVARVIWVTSNPTQGCTSPGSPEPAPIRITVALYPEEAPKARGLGQWRICDRVIPNTWWDEVTDLTTPPPEPMASTPPPEDQTPPAGPAMEPPDVA